MGATNNILIVGVGGQGVLLASELMSAVAFRAGFDTKKSEVHGMAQRGGVVSSHVRYGAKVYSPLIPEGQTDLLLAFEEAEALRWSHSLRSGGTCIVNRYRLVPPIASLKGYSYPSDPLSSMSEQQIQLISVDANAISIEVGNPKAVNIALLGVVSVHLTIPIQVWEDCIRERVPAGTSESNLHAFHLGRKWVE